MKMRKKKVDFSAVIRPVKEETSSHFGSRVVDIRCVDFSVDSIRAFIKRMEQEPL